jgi:hypothetical protein
VYWAAEERDEDLAAGVKQRIARFYDHLRSTGRLTRWERVESLYYGEDADSGMSGHEIVELGEAGETIGVRANHLRAIVRQSLNLATGTEPSIHAKADNNDYRSAAHRKLAEALYAHHQARGDLSAAAKRAAEYTHTHGEGYTVQVWDDDAGERYGVEQYTLPEDEQRIVEYQRALGEWQARQAEAQDPIAGYRNAAGRIASAPPQPPDVEERFRVVYQGDVRYVSPHPVDVIRDTDLEDPRQSCWYILRLRKDRYDLAARYPEFEDEILNATLVTDEFDAAGLKRRDIDTGTADSDLVTIYELYHAPCHSLPWGLRACMVGGVIVHREQLRYATMPIHVMVASVEGSTPFGYAPAFDLIGLQQAYDAGLAALLTNMDALGMQKFWVPDASACKPVDLGDGIKMFQGGTAPPVALKLLEGILGSTDWLQYLERQLGMISGMNEVARGDPSSLKAGVALAFQSALAVQAASDMQYAYARHLESIGTALIELYQVHATTERVIEIAGKRDVSKAKRFTGKDVADVKRITVDLGNPALRTASGRIDIAEKLLTHPTMPISPKQFLEVMATGRLDPVTEGPDTERGLIESENEVLMEGGAVEVSLLDNHESHIQGHRLPMMDADMRSDPAQQAAIAALLAHIDEHVAAWQQLSTQSPVLMALAGLVPQPGSPLLMFMPPPPMMGPPGMPPGAPGPMPPGPGGPMPPGAGPPPQGGPPVPMPGVDGAPGTVGVKKPNMPGLPPNTPPELQGAGLPAM